MKRDASYFIKQPTTQTHNLSDVPQYKLEVPHPGGACEPYTKTDALQLKSQARFSGRLETWVAARYRHPAPDPQWIIQNTDLITPDRFTQQFIYVTEVTESDKLWNKPSRKKQAFQLIHLVTSGIDLSRVRKGHHLILKTCTNWRKDRDTF